MSTPFFRHAIPRHACPRVFAVLSLFALFASIGARLAFAQIGATPAAQKWALLIGIDEYKDKNRINNLGAATADARALKSALVEVAGFPASNVRLLVSDADPARGESTPEHNTILRALANLTEHVKPGDTVFVLYSGHGIETGGKTYLLPYDTDAFDENTLTDTAIETEKFRDRLQAVHAGTLIMAFDMCRTNPRKGAKGASEPNNLTALQLQTLDFSHRNPDSAGKDSAPAAPVVVTFFACSPDQQSYEWAEKGRGYFSYFLEEGLRGSAADRSGAVHLNRLAEYVSSHVEQQVFRDEGREQIPFFELKGSASDIVMASGVFPVAEPIVAAAVDAATVDTVGRFRLVVSPTGARMTVDGAPVVGKLASIDLGVEKTKTVAVTIEAPGCTPEERQVTIQRGLNPPVVVLLSGSKEAIEAASAPTGAPVGAASAESITSLLRLFADGGARATFRRDDGGDTLTINVQSIASDPIRVRASYRAVGLKEGQTYDIQFRARADRARTLVVLCPSATGDPRAPGLTFSQRIGTDFQEYRVRFRATHISHGANYIPTFVLGDQLGAVQISHLTMTPVDN